MAPITSTILRIMVSPLKGQEACDTQIQWQYRSQNEWNETRINPSFPVTYLRMVQPSSESNTQSPCSTGSSPASRQARTASQPSCRTCLPAVDQPEESGERPTAGRPSAFHRP